MNATQQTIITTIESCNSHSAIDGAIQQVDSYREKQPHEALFIQKCIDLITNKIISVAFNNNILAN